MADTDIETAIRAAVLGADLDTTTLSEIRNCVVAELGLPSDFFKQPEWKKKSAALIDEVIQSQLEAEMDDNDRESGRDSKTNDLDNATCRVPREESEQLEPPEGESHEDLILDEPKPKKRKSKAKSELIAESKTCKADPTKSGPAKSGPTKSGPAKSGPAKSAPTKTSTLVSPDQIVKLKSQLLKCGIRKQWNKILDPLANDKARISYLQDQLADLGMTGRFSEARAKKIKQEREIALEIADVTEAAESFTKGPARKPRKIAMSDSED